MGDKTKLGVSSSALVRFVKPGSEVLLDYGIASLLVTAVDLKTREVHCTVQNQAVLGANKKIHLPGRSTQTDTCTQGRGQASVEPNAVVALGFLWWEGLAFNDLKTVITDEDVADIAFACKVHRCASLHSALHACKQFNECSWFVLWCAVCSMIWTSLRCRTCVTPMTCERCANTSRNSNPAPKSLL